MKLNELKNYIITNLRLRWYRIVKFFRGFYKHQHQLTSTTSTNRYPELFSEVKRTFDKNGSSNNSTILSFGCSTGEECFSLRHYFEHSRIVGVDINKVNLRKANRANRDSNIVFLFSDESTVSREGPYDIIFCLSVLCRWNDTEFVDNCTDIYPFSKYEETIAFLTKQLKKEGLLVIYNSNFRFEDSFLYSQFESIETPTVSNSGFVHKFNASNVKIHDAHAGVVYRKKS